MITAIQVNYEDRGVLGEREDRHDRLDGFITARHVDKAVEAVIRKGTECYAAAHFNHDDGSNDSIWQEWGQRGTRMLTWRHDNSDYSREKPTEISSADFKRRIKKHLEGAA